jgi:hypothetical protein
MATIRGADTPSVFLIRAMDSVHPTVDLFYGISFRKIIPKIWKIAGTWNFAKIPLNFSVIMF